MGAINCLTELCWFISLVLWTWILLLIFAEVKYVIMFLFIAQSTSGGLYRKDNYVIMTTVEKEKYKCLLPSLSSNQEVWLCMADFKLQLS